MSWRRETGMLTSCLRPFPVSCYLKQLSQTESSMDSPALEWVALLEQVSFLCVYENGCYHERRKALLQLHPWLQSLGWRLCDGVSRNYSNSPNTSHLHQCQSGDLLDADVKKKNHTQLFQHDNAIHMLPGSWWNSWNKWRYRSRNGLLIPQISARMNVSGMSWVITSWPENWCSAITWERCSGMNGKQTPTCTSICMSYGVLLQATQVLLPRSGGMVQLILGLLHIFWYGTTPSLVPG